MATMQKLMLLENALEQKILKKELLPLLKKENLNFLGNNYPQDENNACQHLRN